MAKIRVYELARELKVESKSLLAKLKDLGITVVSHQSTLTPAQVEKARSGVGGGSSAQPKVVVRRRKKSEAGSCDEDKMQSEEGPGTGSEFEGAAPGDSDRSRIKTVKRKKTSDKIGAEESETATTMDVKNDSQFDGKNDEKLNFLAADSSAAAEELVEVAPQEIQSDESASGENRSKNAVQNDADSISPAIEIVHESIDNIDNIDNKGLDASTQSKKDEAESHLDPSTLGISEPEVKDQVEGETVHTRSGDLKNNVDAKTSKSYDGVRAGYSEAEQSNLKSKERLEKIIAGDFVHSSKKVAGDLEKKYEQGQSKSISGVSGSTSSAVRRKEFSGATIVRRATPQEIEETRAKEQARQRAPRREDSKGVRVTGIGVSSRAEQNRQERSGYQDKTSSADREPLTEGAWEDADYSGASDHAGGGKWSKDRKDKGFMRTEDESIGRPRPSGVSGKKRFSMRDLIANYDTDVTSLESEDSSFGGEGVGRKRKTVYTPSSSMSKRREQKKRRKDFKATEITTPRAAYRVIKIDGDTITVADLARQLSIKSAEIIKKLMGQGVMATINQSLDFDTASLIASEYNFECKNVEKTFDDYIKTVSIEYDEDDYENRPPIITVMGHVDHGKTSILDAIRSSNVASGESGGITQHIGAYMVRKKNTDLTFLDTPGHAAFSAMRARGANLTDIIVLVVAADDGVMPQTIEAISHAQSAGVPIIVAVNKIDKPNQNLDRIYSELSEHGVQAEEWGGENQFVKVSALKKQGIDELLEAIQLQSEMLELKAPIKGKAEGVVVEAHLDKQRGAVATVIVTKGKLKSGENIVVGSVVGKTRVMHDFKGKKITEALPSTPVQIVGLDQVPMSGDRLFAFDTEKAAKDAADLIVKEDLKHKFHSVKSATANLEDFLGKVSSAEIPAVNFIVKADTQGSVEAIQACLDKLNTEKVKNVIIHKAVGGINESDLNLAETSKAIILGFNVRAGAGLDDLADKKGVVVKYYSIIYDLVDAVKNIMSGKLPPIEHEVIQGHAEVRNAINVPKIGTIAGSSVIDGKITRSSHLRLIRDEIVIYSGRIGSLRRFKDDVKEVQNGYECGISIDGYTDIKVGDVIEAFMIEEKAATLEFNDI